MNGIISSDIRRTVETYSPHVQERQALCDTASPRTASDFRPATSLSTPVIRRPIDYNHAFEPYVYRSRSENSRTNADYLEGSESYNKKEISGPQRPRSSTIRVPCSVITPPAAGPLADSSRPAHSGGKDLETQQLADSLKSIVELKEFLAFAPTQFEPGEFIRQFRLPTEEQISCVRWKQVFCITGTDIVRALIHRFNVFGREVTNRKKFEEGVFSDLRNLKINVDATLENPKSELLELLYKHHCVRTKKKQKVFFWYSVQHDQLFIDTLERELKRESAFGAEGTDSLMGPVRVTSSSLFAGSPASTKSVREPALSFKFNSAVPLADQIESITSGLPKDFATLVDATTTSFESLTTTQPIPTKSSPNMPSSARHTDIPGSDHPYNAPPMTPIQKPSKGFNRNNLPISPWQHQHQPALATPESLTSIATPPTSVSSVQTPTAPWAHPSGYGALGGTIADTASPPFEGQSKFHRANSFSQQVEDTDFPLDLLAQHDQEHQKPPVDTSFYNKYHDFVYNNRPALSIPPQYTQPGQSASSLTYSAEWERGRANEDETPFLDQRHASVAGLWASNWNSSGTHSPALDPPFEMKPTRRSPIRRSSRVSKYATHRASPPNIPEGAYTNGY